MEQIAPKHMCSGCWACYNTCPVGAINMECDKEGFMYPIIDTDKCIDCGKCKNICPAFKEYCGNKNISAYACINKNEDIRMESSSGGIFSLIAEAVIDKGGAVFGAAFDEEFNVRHIYVENKKDISKLRGSKYVQSDIGDTYKIAENFLKQNRPVLFSGTPCQISGLKAYLGMDYENLIALDLVCHGAPSQKVFELYLKEMQKKCDASVTNETKIQFRDKISGWYGYSVSIKFDQFNVYCKNKSQDAYMKAYLSNLSLRPSCYNCHNKSVHRQGDVTLGDFWGIKELHPEMFDNKGTSLILINTDKGERIFEEISDNIQAVQVDVESAIKRNTAVYKASKMPKTRAKFMASLDTVDFKKNVEECTKPGIVLRIKKLIKRGIKYVQK